MCAPDKQKMTLIRSLHRLLEQALNGNTAKEECAQNSVKYVCAVSFRSKALFCICLFVFL